MKISSVRIKMVEPTLNRPLKSLEDQLYEAELELAHAKKEGADPHRVSVLAMHCNALQEAIKARTRR